MGKKWYISVHVSMLNLSEQMDGSDFYISFKKTLFLQLFSKELCFPPVDKQEDQ